jgi:hypothetical protein
MHVAADSLDWFAASADKILFCAMMEGITLRTPRLIPIIEIERFLPDAPTITDAGELADKLCANTAFQSAAPTDSTLPRRGAAVRWINTKLE